MNVRIAVQIAIKDARFASRMARRNQGFTLLAVATLALGIGSTTAIFSVVKAVLLNQLPYRDPERVVSLAQIDSITPGPGISLWTAHELRSRTQSFASISLYGDVSRTLVENGETEVLRGLRVDHEFFETLGMTMLLGRSFRPDEDRWPRANVVILSHELWTRRFGADPNIIGRVLSLSSEPYQVIGVLPPGAYPLRMSNPAEKPEIFMPQGYDPRTAAACKNCLAGYPIGRLKQGIGVNQASAELHGVMSQITREYPSDFMRDTSVLVEPMRDHLVGPIEPALWMLLGAVAFVLLIACANIANLLLARATARTKEIAIRAALGCSRPRLIGQLMTESLLLATMGGAAGIVLGWRSARLLASLPPKELPRLDEVRMDVTVLIFALGITIASGLFFGILPALRASRLEPARPRERRGSRSALVIAEVALAFVLAVGTGLLAKSFVQLTSVDAGFDATNILTLTPEPTPVGRYASPQGLLGYYRAIVDKVRTVPGVLDAAMVSNVPLSHTEPAKLRIQGDPDLTASHAPGADIFWASPDYFRVLKITLQRGRFFNDHDDIDETPVALISESLAKSRFPDSDPLGRRIQLGPRQDPGQQDNDPWFTIVGIVGDVRNNGFDQPPDEAVYIPQAADPFHYTRLVVRTAGDPMSFQRVVLAAIREVDPLQPVFHVQPLNAYVASYLAGRAFTLTLIGLFGTMALLLAAIGIYGVISYTVSQRTREVGIRMALGAGRLAVLKLILQDVFVLLAGGLASGFLCASALTRFLSHLLFEVRPTDLPTSAGVAFILSCVALFAAYIPARRAMSVDPAQALRSE